MSAEDPFGPTRKPMDITAVLSRLRGVSGEGPWNAACPVHDDTNPSMSVSESITGNVLLNCFKCCAELTEQGRREWFERAMAILSGATAVEFEAKRYARKARRDEREFTVVRAHDYLDANGHEVYRKVISKTADGSKRPGWFRNANPPGARNAAGEPLRPAWVAGIAGADPGLYRAWALPPDGPVVLVEGEKDADTMARLGHVALSPPHGAGTWRDVWTAVLAGREVAIVADADEAGRKHAHRVAAKLRAAGCQVSAWEPQAPHGDVSDAVEAGLVPTPAPGCLVPLQALAEPAAEEDDGTGRRMRLTPASEFKIRRVRWLWDGRMPCGALSLIGGREGLGKSTVAYWLAARITRGELPGEFYGQPKGVLVCATEDSWEHTVVPRLIAAGADLDRVYCVEMVTDDVEVGLSLPRDLLATERAARETDAALLLLDPLMSRLAADLDTHRDSEVRRALEPLASMSDRTGMAVVGLIHLNKSGSADPLTALMGSRAFAAVARAVSLVAKDPNDESGLRKFFGTEKNNLGSLDLPLLPFTVESTPIETEDDGTAWTGAIVWQDEIEGSITEVMQDAATDDETRTVTASAVEWLRDFLTANSGVVRSSDAKAKAKREADISIRTLDRARRKLKIKAEFVKGVSPPVTLWRLPAPRQPGQVPWGECVTGITDIDAGQASVSELSAQISVPVVPVTAPPREGWQTSPPEAVEAPTPEPVPEDRDAELRARPLVCDVCQAAPPQTWVMRHLTPYWVIRCQAHNPWVNTPPTEAS